MKSVKKFKTFDELKSCENKKMDEVSALKNHFDFEKLLTEIRKVKENKVSVSQTDS